MTSKYIPQHLTVAKMLEARKEREDAARENRLKGQAKEVTSALETLHTSNTDTEIRISGTLDPIIKTELNELGYKTKEIKDNGGRGSGYTFTYISIK